MKYVGAIDQGTTSTRFILFDHRGLPAGSEQIEHRQIFPKPGWVEHDPMEIWANTTAVIRDTLNKLGATAADIAAIGITNQRETTVVWDRKTGKPVYNAIVWQDTRTDTIVDELAKDKGIDRFRAKVGLPLATYFSATKLKWILENVPGIRTKAESGDLCFGTIDTWVIWNLTGGAHITDVTNASRTMLMNLETLEWDEEMLKVFDIPKAMLPEIRSSSDEKTYGRTAGKEGIPAGIPVSGCLGDQQAALFGQGCFDIGEAKNTYGTGCFMLANIGHKPVISRYGLLTTLGYKIGSDAAVYALEGSVAITGALIQWLRDNLGLIRSSSEIETLARTVDDNGGIYFVPAFSGLFAPYWKSDARGVIVGMTRYVNKGHFARAALEATAFQTKEMFEAMEKDMGEKVRSLKVDGGMVVNELLMQFQSDILNIPVIRPKVTETTALGAAYAAGLAVGFWKGLEDIRSNWVKEKQWTPQMSGSERDKQTKYWLKAVSRSFDWVE